MTCGGKTLVENNQIKMTCGITRHYIYAYSFMGPFRMFYLIGIVLPSKQTCPIWWDHCDQQNIHTSHSIIDVYLLRNLIRMSHLTKSKKYCFSQWTSKKTHFIKKPLLPIKKTFFFVTIDKTIELDGLKSHDFM